MGLGLDLTLLLHSQAEKTLGIMLVLTVHSISLHTVIPSCGLHLCCAFWFHTHSFLMLNVPQPLTHSTLHRLAFTLTHSTLHRLTLIHSTLHRLTLTYSTLHCLHSHPLYPAQANPDPNQSRTQISTCKSQQSREAIRQQENSLPEGQGVF